MGWASGPKPDPAIGEAAQRNAAIAERQQQVAEQELAYTRERDARYDPYYQRLLDQQIAEGDRMSKFGQEELDRVRSVVRPLEDRMVADANDWDSAEAIQRATGEAAAGVQTQWDAARDQNARLMAANGVSPDSGRTVQGGIDDANNLALAKVGAVNTTTNQRKLQGIQLRAGAASQLRGSANTGLAGLQGAVGANAAAGGVPGQQAGLHAAGMQTSLGFTGSAMNGNTAAANILLGRNQLEQSRANSQFRNVLGGIKEGAGIVGGLMAMSDENTKRNIRPIDSTGGVTPFRQLAVEDGEKPATDGLSSAVMAAAPYVAEALSDENAKQGAAPVENEGALAALRKVPVSQWEYKPGMGDGGEHIGPMAQDVQAALGDEVAPGGKQIDLISMNGVNMAAIKALDAKVTRLTKMLSPGAKEPVTDAREIGLKPLRM